MKIKLFSYKNVQYQLKINRCYYADKAIIPIGSDCHPAYMLTKMELRNESLPFDWLDTKPIFALQYAYENIRDSFCFFMDELKINSDGKVYAEKYPCALFYHFDDLPTNKILKSKIEKRIQRFLYIIQSKSCCFVHSTTSITFDTNNIVIDYVETVKKFISLLKKDDELLIYLRYDETIEENKINCEKLFELISPLRKCRIIRYLRNKSKFGDWGDETKYIELIRDLSIKRKWNFFKIRLIKSKINK
jgi:hypothetical protein